MQFTHSLKDLTSQDVMLAGGKGASLGEMIHAQIPVPGWFVVSSQTFDYFLDTTGLDIQIQALLDRVDHHTISTLESASESIQSLILSLPLPEEIEKEIMQHFVREEMEYVAVRSSATAEDGVNHARAGQLETYLNITQDQVVDKVRQCRSSLFSPRAIFYRFEKDLHTDHISVAVVVQKMLQSEISGIAFSVHPVTQDHDQMIIEAWYGLGEAIVSWTVTPDSYVVRKSDKVIQSIHVNHQHKALFRSPEGGNERHDLGEKWKEQILTEDQILALADIVVTIEKHYWFPCDIEWAYEWGEFFILQSRPITTLQAPSSPNTVLSCIYSRERSLLYFVMRNDSDRLGYKDFLHHDVQHNLFMIPPRGSKGSVWYSSDELDSIHHTLTDKLLNDYDSFVEGIFAKLNEKRSGLLPYLSGEKVIATSSDFAEYYNTLISRWSAMNTVFTVPDMPEVDEALKEKILTCRAEAEKFSGKMNSLMVEYFENAYPSQSHLSHVVTPQEVIDFETIQQDENALSHIQSRLQGCFMLDEKVYPLEDMHGILQQHGLALKKVEATYNETLQGSTAYLWNVQGRVCLVHGLQDLAKVQQGDVMVTEMTSPEYVPAMKKCLAIITDEWGITSHAAIVAREMDKPCIIWTKIATKVLHDGDLVEVDADQGIVRIIESAKAPETTTWSEIFHTQISLSEWFENVPWFDAAAFKQEDNEKRSRLEQLSAIIPLVYDHAKSFAATELIEKNSAFMNFFEKNSNQLCALRLVPLDTSLPKLRMRGKTVKDVYENWFFQQDIADYSTYRADFMQHNETNSWSTIFVVNEQGIYGEIIADSHHHLTQWLYTDQTPITFSYDFVTWQLSVSDARALEHLQKVIACIYIPSQDIQSKIEKAFATKCAHDYLTGYFETVDLPEWGICFLDRNRLLDKTLWWPLPHISQSHADGLQGIAVKSMWMVKGEVVIVRDCKDTNMSDWHILVCEMTTPEFLPLMKKASAIITNKWWILSHAAIVCRELTIPCIVGTKLATKVLHDGDMIELDTDSGVVRILS